jgi:acyl carrier protein
LAKDLRTVTDGEGIEVVLTNMPSRLNPAVLSFLTANGRLILLGAEGGADGEVIRQTHPDVLCSVIDPAELIENEPALVQHVLARLPEAYREAPASEDCQCAAPETVNRDAEFFRQWSEAAPEMRLSLLTDYLQRELAELLGLEVQQVGLDEPLNYLGVDSLMALDLRNRVKDAVGLYISTSTFIEGATVASLAGHLARQLSQSDSSALLKTEAGDDQDWVEGEV